MKTILSFVFYISLLFCGIVIMCFQFSYYEFSNVPTKVENSEIAPEVSAIDTYGSQLNATLSSASYVSSPNESARSDATSEEILSYDRLLKTILHPETFCKVSKTYGGRLHSRSRKLDGNKTLCLNPGPRIKKGDCIVYSFGVNYDWSFEEAVVKNFRCKVYTFDPSMDMNSHKHGTQIWFYDIGIDNFDGEIEVDAVTWKMKTFHSILEQLHHQNKTIDILKMDIEGDEVDVLEDILSQNLFKNINHLNVELHLLKNPQWNRVLQLLEAIKSETGMGHFSTVNNSATGLEKVLGFQKRYEQHYFEMAWYRRQII